VYDNIAMWVSHVGGIEVVSWYRKLMIGKVREEEKEGVLYYMDWLVS